MQHPYIFILNKPRQSWSHIDFWMAYLVPRYILKISQHRSMWPHPCPAQNSVYQPSYCSTLLQGFQHWSVPFESAKTCLMRHYLKYHFLHCAIEPSVILWILGEQTQKKDHFPGWLECHMKLGLAILIPSLYRGTCSWGIKGFIKTPIYGVKIP